ncbi:MAG: hypothetical protein GWM90_31130 [Gemmatimonadetes bacterium]|nr:hypothetical protein [Gemmatimonadota bacterium]NIQ59670.1 hypothetical protein [Gemmatimonadota bacterium]NIU79871.1 hypothetical protein [Gammaproteobacteria bacterium]NIX48354.1 hypothetical protein [Gemmatimonadota bacterium]NIY12801.1 hypothetical protein [Gemmatimonadota bacterium]
MTGSRFALLLALAALAAGCVENTAPGNDREAAAESPSPAAEVASAGEALSGVATALVLPEILTEPDLRSLPGLGDRCVFRFTRVGYPAFVFGSTTGVIKLNGRLVPLPAGGDGLYAEGAVTVTVRPLSGEDGGAEDGGQVPAELVLRLQDAPNELGFHGFSEC